MFDFQKRVVVSDPITWIPFVRESLVYLDFQILVKYLKLEENLNLIQSDEQRWYKDRSYPYGLSGILVSDLKRNK